MNSPTAAPCVSIVLPCYNEEECLPHTAEVLKDKMSALCLQKIISEDSRILFVDDGSEDDTWHVIKTNQGTNQFLFGGVKLAHNRRHQQALYADLMGALQSGCDAATSMDADLQDDVNAIDEMICKFTNEHCEIVYGVRSSRESDTWFKRNTVQMFYRVSE